MRKRSHKTTNVVVIRHTFRARSVSKCVCRGGSAPDPTEEAYIILPPSSVVPVRKSIALMVPWLSGWPNFSSKTKGTQLILIPP